MSAFAPVDLAPHCNAFLATADDERSRGCVNAWGNSFPAEELPRGRTIWVAGTPFDLPTPGRRGDHVEANGQRIELLSRPTIAIDLLCFGEMGEQEATVTIDGAGPSRLTTVRVPGWLIEGLDPEGAWSCSHLHYPNDLEVTTMRPVLWHRSIVLPEARRVLAIRLAPNPLFHLAAVTTVLREAGR